MKENKKLSIYTAPKDILNSIELEENNEIVEDLNKKISESTFSKKNNSRFKREISPERIDPMKNINKSSKIQNYNERSYKEIMLEQKKLEEKEKNLKSQQQRIYSTESDRKSNQYNNINYNSRILNPISRRDNENYSLYTKETKMTSVINNYEKNKDEKDEYLSRKRNKNITEDKEDEEEEEYKYDKNKKINIEEIKSTIKDENESQHKNDEEDYSIENYDIPTPKNETESESEVTEINEKRKKENESNMEEEKEDKKENKSIKEEEKNDNIIEEKMKMNEKIINDKKVKIDLKYNLDFLERNRPLTDEEINAILPWGKRRVYNRSSPN